MEKSPAPALSKGLHIIDLVAKEETLSFGQLQKLTGYNVSSLNRYIKVLLESGYLSRTKDQKYMIGMKSVILSKSNTLWRSLVNRSKKVLEYISEKYEVTVLVIGYGENSYTALNKIAHKDNLTMMEIGHTEKDILTHAPWGIPYLAYNDESTKSNILAQLEEEKRVEINEMLNEIEDQGYLTYKSNSHSEILRIAVPLVDRSGQLIGVLGMGTFYSKFHKDTFDTLIRDMLNGVEEIVG
ncbi:helix-turn-helix domain-containing protein [Vallitalea okinawensis]|uniref:helix-turn-helix domain-containing protein n=1 Tax=Vallitalea okinawensis TaxID=2078660 RepID=UPI001300203C|nr:helix-turn-helix domain-containing protein [Vallitalea okinawensis]